MRHNMIKYLLSKGYNPFDLAMLKRKDIYPIYIRELRLENQTLPQELSEIDQILEEDTVTNIIAALAA